MLEETAIFVKVAQLGSFSGAAKALKIPPSTVSTRVSQLESELGITLLHRTTRKVRLTPAGDTYFRRCVKALEEFHSARMEVSESSKPLGRLRITSSVDVAHWMLPPLIRQYRHLHPQVEIELMATNRVVDIIGEGVDVAIRMGELKDSSLIVRKLNIGAFGLFATPAYLKSHKPFAAPEEALHHEFIQFSPVKMDRLPLTRGNESKVISAQGSIWVDDIESIKYVALQDLGIALLPEKIISTELASGQLVPLLSDWTLPFPNVANFVYPAQRFVPAKVRAFLDLAFASERDLNSPHWTPQR